MEDREAYSGKYIRVQNKQYQLVPEIAAKGCKGCAFENQYNCYNLNLVDNCRKGFIYKTVK